MSELTGVASGADDAFLPGRRSMRAVAVPALRFVIVYVALTGVFYAAGDRYSAWWRAPIKIALAALPAPVVVHAVELSASGDQQVFRMRARTRESILTARGNAPAGVKLDTTTLQAYAHHHVILILAVLAAWPVRRAADRAVLLAAGVPAIVLATILDIPFTLIGVAREAILAASDPQALGHDAGVLYYQFLQRGGRQVLSLTMAGLAIVLSQKHHLRLP